MLPSVERRSFHPPAKFLTGLQDEMQLIKATAGSSNDDLKCRAIRDLAVADILFILSNSPLPQATPRREMA